MIVGAARVGLRNRNLKKAEGGGVGWGISSRALQRALTPNAQLEGFVNQTEQDNREKMGSEIIYHGLAGGKAFLLILQASPWDLTMKHGPSSFFPVHCRQLVGPLDRKSPN